MDGGGGGGTKLDVRATDGRTTRFLSGEIHAVMTLQI